MFPLHPGHPGHESALIIVMAIVVVGAAFALTREGWSRVAALIGVAAIAAVSRVGIEVYGIHVHNSLHLIGHGLELSVVVVLGLAGYYVLDVRRTLTPKSDR